MTRFIIILLTLLASCINQKAVNTEILQAEDAVCKVNDGVKVGAERTECYLPIIKDKRVGLYTNHTGILPDGTHTLDLLLDNGIDVKCVFTPEHGFRGTADAGEAVNNSVDSKTGIEIVSLYGSGKAEALTKASKGIDIIIVDIQDVGLRYYTYYITMLELMNAAVRNGWEFLILDRPNPNGMTVDGPILDMKYASGVGRLPIPVVHGLTLGELAQMINGEGWLDSKAKAHLTVVPCEGYTHQTRYRLPVPPSPNLSTMKAVYLYPSLCFFEATDVSVGRGTDHPFEIYGHPAMKNRKYTFTPQSRQGAKSPPQMGKLCQGVYLGDIQDEEIIERGINLEYILDAYKDLKKPGKPMFSSFFEKLIGRGDIRDMIARGLTAEQIKQSWTADVEKFRLQRKPYLLYSED